MDIYALIGRRLGHSFSRDFFTEMFDSQKLNARYINIEMESVANLRELLASDKRIRGVNVTIPFKTDVIPLLDCIDEISAGIGAVNVIKVKRAKDDEIELCGFNTDCIGFAQSISPLLNPDIHTKALILGSGGASAAVKYALQRLGVSPMIVSRTPKAGELAYTDLDSDIIGTHTVIVNATPLGTWPDTATYPPLPYDLLTPQHVCHDLVYNPRVTAFMTQCARRGAVVKNGLEMLHSQALAAWDIWNNPKL